MKYHGNKGLEYYKAYPRDFFEGTVGFPGPLRGFYRMVIDLIYMHDGFLLDDWSHISGQTGFGKTQCKRMMYDLIARGKIYISEENERFFMQKRAVSELKTSRKFQENQANKADKRWKNNGLDIISAMPPQDHKTTRPQDHKTKKEDTIVSSKKQKRACQIHKNWVPNETNVADALSKGLTEVEIQNEAEQFRDHHLARGSAFKDWNAAWRTWIRNSIKFKAGRAKIGGGMAGGATAYDIADRGAKWAANRKAGG